MRALALLLALLPALAFGQETIRATESFETSSGTVVYATPNFPVVLLDASEIASITSSAGEVTTWANLGTGGSTYNFTAQESGEDEPDSVYQDFSGVSRHCIDFNGSNESLQCTSVPVSINGAYTLFVVSECDQDTANQYTFCFTDQSSNTDYGIFAAYIGATTDPINEYAIRDSILGAPSDVGNTVEPYSTGTVYVTTYVQASSSSRRGATDGVLSAINTTSRTLSGIDTCTISGAWWPSDIFSELDGRVHEIRIYDYALSIADREAVENLLVHKWKGIAP